MLLRWSEKIASFFLQKNLLKQDQYEWAVYALQIRLLQCIAFPVLIITGSILSSMGSVLCFLVSFSTLRRKIGGYHAPTPIACFIVSLITVAISMSFGMKIIHTMSLVTILLLLLSCFLLLLGHSAFYRYIHSDRGRCVSFLHACAILLVLSFISVLLLRTKSVFSWAHAIILGVFAAVISLLPKNKQGATQE